MSVQTWLYIISRSLWILTTFVFRFDLKTWYNSGSGPTFLCLDCVKIEPNYINAGCNASFGICSWDLQTLSEHCWTAL